MGDEGEGREGRNEGVGVIRVKVRGEMRVWVTRVRGRLG